MSVHVSQFYSCSKVKLACELYYICELGKYSTIQHNQPVDLQGVVLTSGLKKSLLWDYFRMSVSNGWLVNTCIAEEELAITVQHPLGLDKTNHRNLMLTTEVVEYDKEEATQRRQDADFDLRTPVKSQVSFERMEPSLWLWTSKGKDGKGFSVNNKSLNHNFADMAWVSLVAMVAVHRLFEQEPNMLAISFSGNMLINSMALSHLMVLDSMTQCMRGWVFYEFDSTVNDNTKLQLSYFAWYSIGREFGMLDRWYNGKEKFRYMQQLDLQPGDIVLYYEREPEQKMNYIKSIAGCYVAKIVKVNSRDIELELINTTMPRFAGKEAFDDHSMAAKMLYSDKKPYETMRTSRQTKSMADIGVEYMLYSEHYFIVPLSHASDMIPTRVTDGTREETLLLDQNNLIYWILEDYEYEYNRERFLDRYFKGIEPVRDRYLRGDELERSYYPAEEG